MTTAQIKKELPAYGFTVGQKVNVRYFAYDKYYVFVNGKNIALVDEYYLGGV